MSTNNHESYFAESNRWKRIGHGVALLGVAAAIAAYPSGSGDDEPTHAAPATTVSIEACGDTIIDPITAGYSDEAQEAAYLSALARVESGVQPNGEGNWTQEEMAAKRSGRTPAMGAFQETQHLWDLTGSKLYANAGEAPPALQYLRARQRLDETRQIVRGGDWRDVANVEMLGSNAMSTLECDIPDWVRNRTNMIMGYMGEGLADPQDKIIPVPGLYYNVQKAGR